MIRNQGRSPIICAHHCLVRISSLSLSLAASYIPLAPLISSCSFSYYNYNYYYNYCYSCSRYAARIAYTIHHWRLYCSRLSSQRWLERQFAFIGSLIVHFPSVHLEKQQLRLTTWRPSRLDCFLECHIQIYYAFKMIDRPIWMEQQRSDTIERVQHKAMSSSRDSY